MGKVYIGVMAVGGHKLWEWLKGERVLVEVEVGELTGHCCVYCRIRSKISLRILCKSRILLL